jgi:putative SOS response-associated peptidase YedK
LLPHHRKPLVLLEEDEARWLVKNFDGESIQNLTVSLAVPDTDIETSARWSWSAWVARVEERSASIRKTPENSPCR